MDLKQTIITNRNILALIESKYPDPPSCWPQTPESRYYTKLLQDTQHAQEALRHGGLATPPDPNQP